MFPSQINYILCCKFMYLVWLTFSEIAGTKQKRSDRKYIVHIGEKSTKLKMKISRLYAQGFCLPVNSITLRALWLSTSDRIL